MIEIKGSIKTFPRACLPAGVSYDNAIYDLSKSELRQGRRQIKGLFGSFLDDKLFVPYGRNGFFYTYIDSKTKSELGVKVYYSFDRMRVRSKIHQQDVWNKYASCYEAGISPKPVALTDVKLDLTVNSAKINSKCFGLIIEKAHYPEKSLEQFARGQFYDFDYLDKLEHIDHNPQAFKEFRKKATKIISKLGITGCGTKLGDIIYCTKNKRWYVVDCG